LKEKIESYLSAIGAVCIWGTTFSISKFFIPLYLNTFTFTAIRLMLGTTAIFLYLIISRQLKRWAKIFWENIKMLAITGIFFLGGSYILQYLGIAYTRAVNQAIISNTQTFWLILFNFLIFKRKPDKKFIPSAFLAFTGVILIILNDEFKISTETILGDIISVFAFISWGLYSLFAKILNTNEKSIFITSSLLLFAMISILPISLFVGLPTQLINLPHNLWPVMLYLGIIAMGVTFLLWNNALSNKEIKTENIVIITMLNPVVGIITSVILLGEEFTFRTFLGTLLVLFAVFIVNYNFKSNNKSKKIKIKLN